jgi:hypothetical protein
MFANSSRAQASAIRFQRCHLDSRQNRATEPASGHAPSQSLGSTCWTNFEPHGHFAVGQRPLATPAKMLTIGQGPLADKNPKPMTTRATHSSRLSGSGRAVKARLLALDGLFNSRLPIIISPDRRPDPAKGTWQINPAMKRISAPTMIEDGRLSGNEPAARWFDETARHQFLRECELEGLITERTAYGPFGYLSSLHARRTKLADQPRSTTSL